MKLLGLQLEHFKNYERLSVDLSDKKILILVGKNGHGKTNFLESIVVLALSKGFSSTALTPLISWSSKEAETGLPEYFRVLGQVQTSAGRTDLEVGTSNRTKSLKINGVKTKPYDYIGHLRVVLFTPQDLNMVMLSPQLRRKYINVFLSQIDPEYLKHLGQYQAVLKHRNKLLDRLRETGKLDELDYWDDQLAEYGAYLLWKRRQVFSSLNQRLSINYEKISHQAVEFFLEWKKPWPEASLQELHRSFRDYLESKRSRDIEAGTTCGGPHREDFVFQMNGRNLANFASRGECRSAVLSLKMAEADYMKEVTGETPVVLFDDVFSELDVDRQKNLLELFEVDQVIISTTHVDFVPEGAVVWQVENGTITSRDGDEHKT